MAGAGVPELLKVALSRLSLPGLASATRSLLMPAAARGCPARGCPARGWYWPGGSGDQLTGTAPAWRARKAAALTRFWQDVEQNRRVPLRE